MKSKPAGCLSLWPLRLRNARRSGLSMFLWRRPQAPSAYDISVVWQFFPFCA